MPAPSRVVDVPQVSPGQLRLVFLAVAAVLFLASLGQTVVTAALPIIVGELGGLDRIAWVITAYLLAATVGAPVFGKLGDMFGRKVVMQAGIVVFLLGSVLAASAGSIWMLVVGRFVQGLGGGGLIVVSMATVADVVPPRQRGRYQGMLGAVFGLSTVVGPLAGGFVVQHMHWSWMFLLNLPLGGIAFAILTSVLAKRTPGPTLSLDYAGVALLTATLSGAVIVASLGGELLPWADPLTWGLIAASLAALAGFLAVERRAAAPVLPLQLFRINNFVVSNSVGVITGVAMFSTLTFVPMFMQVAKGLSPAASGLFVVPMMMGLIGASTLAGQIMSRTGRYRMLPVYSMALLSVAMGLMATVTPATPNWTVALYISLAGIGIGPVMGVGVTAIQNSVPSDMVGVGTASANMFRLIGGSIGTALLGAIFAHGLTREVGTIPALAGIDPRALTAQQIAGMDPEMAAHVANGIGAALHPAYLIAAVLAAVGSLVSLMMQEHPLDDRMPGASTPAE